MALTKTVTKVWPVRGNRNIYRIGIHLTLTDDDPLVPVSIPIDQDVTVDYVKGQPPENYVDDIIADAQALIDKYKAEKIIHKTTAYETAIAAVDAGLDITE